MENGKQLSKRKNKVNIFNKSLQRQILLPFLLLLIFAGGVVAFVSYNFSVKNTTNELAENVESQMMSINDTFELFFDNIDNTLDRFAKMDILTNYQSKNKNAILQQFKETSESDAEILNLYTGFEKNKVILIYPATDLGANFNAKESSWYEAAIKAKGKTAWTKPYTDSATGKTVVSAARAYYQDDQLVGVVSVDVLVDTLLDIINKVKIGGTGYAVVFDQDGKYIAHPDTSKIGVDNSDKDYYKKLKKSGEHGIIDYQIDGQDKVMGFVKNPTTNWILAGGVNRSDFEKKAQTIFFPIAISLIIVIAIAVLASLFITRRITKPIQILQSKMKEVENGNLIATIDTSRTDEIGQLSKSFENMLQQMKMMMQKISQISLNVADASQTLVASAEENTASANEVATTMEQIASGAANQSELMEQNLIATDKLSELINQIERENSNMQVEAKSMFDTSSSGLTIVNGLRSQSEQTGKMTKEMVEAIHSLDERSTNISEIVQKIADISSQTNLLALNAAIEAARAGENGRGFAVVADEVRKLAEQSENALKDIAELIGEMQEETKRTVTLINKTSDVIETQSQFVNDTDAAFNQITGTIKANNSMIEK